MDSRLNSRYRLLERLGAGGMGEVFRGEDVRLRRPVALKMLPAQCLEDEAARTRLLREARVASALNHPNIAVIYEIDEVEHEGQRRSYIAMEYVAGRTLEAWAREARPALLQVLEVMEQAADALAEAHARGVTHRDVKPTNLMVAEGGRVKVLDFGLALYAPLSGEEADTWSQIEAMPGGGVFAGTVAYMSPEQARGGEVDARSDVFSLGVVLYELLAGRRPFEGANAMETLDAIRHAEPPPLVVPDPRAGELQRILRKMLAKDRARRYQSMREVWTDLRALREGRTAARNAAPAVAVMAFANITQYREDDWLGTGIAETVTADLMGVPGLTVVGRERVSEVLRKLGLERGGAGEPRSEVDEGLAMALGREVGARWVVTGGYQRLGAMVRLTARVSEVETGTVTRTLKIDGAMSEIFALQDRVVRELSEGLRVSAPSAAADADETEVMEAYEAYAKGLINLRAESRDALDRAILYFERAAAADPKYARAHLQLGSALESKGSYLAMPELFERADACFRRALALRPGLADAWRMLGANLISLDRLEEGVEAIEKALTLAPEDAAAHASMGRAWFVGRGRFAEAAASLERAVALNPQGGWYWLQLSHCLCFLGELGRAEDAARHAIVLQEDMLSGRPGFQSVGAYIRLGQALALQNRHREAVVEYEKELAFLRRSDHALKERAFVELQTRLGSAQAALGRVEAANRALDLAVEVFERRVRLGADEPFTRFHAACAYALKGNQECALDCLEKAIAGRPAFNTARARLEPDLAPLHRHPRFVRLVAVTEQISPATVRAALRDGD